MSWSKISMKYPGKCVTCKKPIPVGDPVLWSKGEGVKHEACASSASAKVILCAVCEKNAGCSTCDMRDYCDIERISPLCICTKCSETDALTAYTRAVNSKFTVLDSSKKIGQNTLG